MNTTGMLAVSASARMVAPTLSLTGPMTRPSTGCAMSPSMIEICLASSLSAWSVIRLIPSVPAAPTAKSWMSFQYGFEMSGTTKPIVGTIGLATGVPGASVGAGASLAIGDAPGDSDWASAVPAPERAAVANTPAMPTADTHLGPRMSVLLLLLPWAPMAPARGSSTYSVYTAKRHVKLQTGIDRGTARRPLGCGSSGQ